MAWIKKAKIIRKSQFTHLLADRLHCNRTEAEKILNSFLASMEDGLALGDRIILRGFGTFEKYTKKERLARNPTTGETLEIPAENCLRFRAALNLKNYLE